jgi:flagellar biosynthesis protein FlhG
VNEHLLLAPAGSGDESMANLDDVSRQRVLNSLALLDEECDLMVFDTGAGIHRSVTQTLAVAHRLIVVTTMEPTSLTNTYSLMRVMAGRQHRAPISIVFNWVQRTSEVREAARQLTEAARRHLDLRVSVLGWIPTDPAVPRSVAQQVPLLLSEPYSPAAQAIRSMAQRLGRDPCMAATPVTRETRRRGWAA